MLPFLHFNAQQHRCLFARWLLAIYLIFPATLAAQNTPVPGATLASVRQWALEHNPELRAQQVEVEAAQAAIISAGSLPNPSASVSLFNGTSYQLRQAIPLWGKRGLARDIAAQQSAMQRATRDANVLNLLAQTESAYVDLWQAQQAVQLIDTQITLLQKIEDIAGVRYALGMAPQQDAIRAQVELTRIQGERIAREEAGNEARMLLNLALGRRADAVLENPQETPVIDIASASLGEALNHLEQQAHPALRAAHAQYEAAQDSLRLRQRERWPDISVGVSAMQRNGGLKDPQLMLEVELPLQRGALNARIHAAQRLAEAAQARKDASLTTLGAQLGAAWSQWRSAQRQRALIESTRIPQAEANFNSALTSYQVGEVDFNALLDALTQWLDAKLERLNTHRDELLGAARVRALAGDTP